ncbi:MAG: hypothetical protein IT431_06355 [Phycisphaerales bacterium]|nr:hypothetical protein [Phycisphaerales bacterium]
MAQAAWIWWLSGGVLAAAGLALLWWSLLRDRARGRRRCPRCWYDMGGVPGLVCPECGWDARRERRLGRTKRKWRWAAIGGLVWIIAFSLGVTPRVRLYGPASLLPTTLLLWASPTIEQTWTTSDNEYLAWLEKQHDGMMIEISRRASTRDSSLADWQWRYWIERKHVIHAWRNEADLWAVFVQVETPLPLGSDDAVRISTAVPTPAQFESRDGLIGPHYPERPPRNGLERPPPNGWVVSEGTATVGWSAYPATLDPYSVLFPPGRGLGVTPSRLAPTLSGRLWDRASESLELKVAYVRDPRERPTDLPTADEQVIVWSGCVTIPIREQAPPWYSPFLLPY